MKQATEAAVLRRTIQALDEAVSHVNVTNAIKNKMLNVRANLMLRLDAVVNGGTK